MTLRVREMTLKTAPGDYRTAKDVATKLRQQADLIEADGRNAGFRLTVKFQPEGKKAKGNQ